MVRMMQAQKSGRCRALIWTRKKDSVSRNPWAGPIEPIVDAGLYGVNVRSQGDARRQDIFFRIVPQISDRARLLQRTRFTNPSGRPNEDRRLAGSANDPASSRSGHGFDQVRRHLDKLGSAQCVGRGAALDIGSQVGIPGQFTLIVLPQKKIYSCNVIWRKERRIAVQFTGPYENPPMA
jgi:hypothetical protein